MSDHGGDVDEVSGMGFWPTGLLDLLGDIPAPAKFHRARGDLAHFGHGDVAVAALDEHAFDAPGAELDSESEPHGSTAADQHGNFGLFRHRFNVPLERHLKRPAPAGKLNR